MARYDHILQTIGSTPVVRLDRMAPEGVHLYAKVESFNPGGSVKDRLAIGVIEDAERRGDLRPGQTVIEATSGNTGIGLAMVCARKGYPLVVTMAENFSVERRKLMRFLGARVILTPAAEKGTGMLRKAEELAAKHGWFLCRQFENEANADIHSRTTAREILADFPDGELDYFLTGFGTGGTLKGIARVLKEESPDTRIMVCEPDNSPLLGSGIGQRRRADGSPAESHPGFRPHLMQGWSPDFISKLAGDVLDLDLIDGFVPVDGQKSMDLARQLATREGILTGISAGATLAGALEVAKQAQPGSTILCMLPDTGERYLSTPLFEPIEAEMNGEEWEISRSTPGYRFDQPTTPAPAAAGDDGRVILDEAALQLVGEAVAGPVVMFALEWCEFCWSVRRLFDRLGIEYRSVDLDAVALQEGDMGGKVRQVLLDRTGSRTIPQIFVGGQFMGGCTEVFDALKSGELYRSLDPLGVSYEEAPDLDPYSLLPGWLEKR